MKVVKLGPLNLKLVSLGKQKRNRKQGDLPGILG